jgi:hypothetical protein
MIIQVGTENNEGHALFNLVVVSSPYDHSNSDSES